MLDDTMWALAKERAAPGLAIRRRPVPRPGPTDVLIRVRLAGICGTDLHLYQWDSWAQSRVRPGIIVGHEFMGEVAAVGDAVRCAAVGDRVSAEGHIGCGACYFCRTGQGHICERVEILGVDVDGGFAEYVRVPESNVWKLHPSIPDRWGALHDPLGNAVHTVMAGEGVSRGRVLVVGLGAIGLMCVMLARAAGAAEVYGVDVNPHKREMALRLGAGAVFDGRSPDLERDVRALVGDRGGVDVALEVSGAPEGFHHCLRLARRGGEVRLLGLPSREVRLDLAEEVIFKGLVLRGINGREIFRTWYQAESFLTGRGVDLDPLISHELPIECFEDAFALLESGEAVKVLLNLEGWTHGKLPGAAAAERAGSPA